MFSNLLESSLDDTHIAFIPPRWISVVAILSLAITMLLAIFIYFGIVLVVLTLATAVLAFTAWLKVGYAQPISRRVLPIYILVIIANLFQGAEQHAGQYAMVLGELFPTLIQDTNVLTNFNFAAVFSLTTTAFYLLGGAIVFYQVRVGGFLVWWLFLWSIIFPASHFVLPLFSVAGFGYVPGMLTSPITILLSVTGIRFVLNCNTNHEASQ